MKQQIEILPAVLIVMDGDLKPLWQRALLCGASHVIPEQHATLTCTGRNEDGSINWGVHGIDHSWSMIIAAGSESSLPTMDEAKVIYADARDFLIVSLLQGREQQKVFHFDGRKLIVGQHMSALLSTWMSLARVIMPYLFKSLETVVQDMVHLVEAHGMLVERTFLLSDPRLEAGVTQSATHLPVFLLVEHLEDYSKLPSALRQIKGLRIGVLPQQIVPRGTVRVISSLSSSHTPLMQEIVSMKKAHKVVTQDFPENIQGGIMICGINYGYSKQEEMADNDAACTAQEPDIAPSFFSDVSVNGGPYKTRILEWLANWGVPLERNTTQPSGLERSYLQTNWIDSQTRSIDSDKDEQINNTVLVERAEDGFLQLLEARRPRVIVFVGLMLIDAFNDIRLRSRVESLLGPWPGKAAMHFGDDSLSKKRFKVFTQKFGDTWVVGLPHTSTQGLSYAYMQSIRLPDALLMALKQATPLAETETVDRLVLEMVRDMGRQNPEQLVSRTQRAFKLGYNRAAQLVSMANTPD